MDIVRHAYDSFACDDSRARWPLETFSTPYEPHIPLLDAAVEYTRRGWPVLPLHSVVEIAPPDKTLSAFSLSPILECTCRDATCKSPGKHPLTRHGVHDASLDFPTIQSWFRKWPWANIGIATGRTSGLVVADTDVWKGSDDAVTGWELEGQLLMSALKAITGRGSQFFFAHPGGRVKSVTDGLAPAVDIKADASYVVGSPSRHVSGRYYTWQHGGDPSPLPQWLTANLRPYLEESRAMSTTGEQNQTRVAPGSRPSRGSEYGHAALGIEIAAVRATTTGGRNSRLARATRCLFELVAGGELQGDEVEQSLRQVGEEIGLGIDEVTRILRSNMKTGVGHPRKAPRNGQASPAVLQRVRDWREHAPPILHGRRTTSRDLAATDVVLDVVENKSKAFDFNLDVRTLGNTIGVHEVSAGRALLLLRKLGVITLVRASDVRANRYHLEPVPATCLSNAVASRNRLQASPRGVLHVDTFAITGHDLFRFGAANKSGARVYAHLLEADTGLTISEVSRALGMHWGTVNAALRRLASFEIVDSVDGRYTAIRSDLDEVASRTRFAGIGKEQRSRHDKERREVQAWLRWRSWQAGPAGEPH